MSYAPPTPPRGLPNDVVDTLYNSSPELLRHVARYAEELAEYREREVRLAEEDDEADIEARPEDLTDDVPAKPTITIKEINDNRYYWQWRDGEKDLSYILATDDYLEADNRVNG